MPKKVTIYHKQLGSAELYTIDAREAVNAHPEEWSSKPWPAAEAKGRKAKDDAPAAEAKGDDKTD